MFTLTPDMLAARLLIALIGIPMHEWAHGFAAYVLGDDTPVRQGRLSLNPITHLDPMGTLMLLMTGYGWGRSAQVNPYKMDKVSNPRVAMALSALAGPIANLIQAGIIVVLLGMGVQELMPTPELTWLVEDLLHFAVAIHVGLIAFNMLPFPPLDGSRVLAGVAPRPVGDFLESLEPIAPILLITVVFVLPAIGINLIRWMARPLGDTLYLLLGW